MKTFHMHALSKSACQRVAAALVSKSQWFEITPLPDDIWRITVKEENGKLLSSLLKPPQILPGYKANYATMLKANENGDLALVSAIRKSDGAPVALVCAMSHDKTHFRPAPLAVMVEGNPYELFEDPTFNFETGEFGGEETPEPEAKAGK